LVDLGELLARVVRADRLREGGRVGPAADVGGGQRDVAVRGLAGGRDLVDVAIGPPAVAQHGFEVDPQFLSDGPDVGRRVLSLVEEAGIDRKVNFIPRRDTHAPSCLSLAARLSATADRTMTERWYESTSQSRC